MNARRHYLRLGIVFDARTIRLEIRSTRNLEESRTRIHRKVPLWIARLEERIRRELGRMSFVPAPD